MELGSFTQGFASSAVLIMAIGAQNAFVLRQGLARRHVLLVVVLCAVSDALLISLGIAGLGAVVQEHPALLDLARWGGAAFLLSYGLMALRRALSRDALAAQGHATLGRGTVVLACLGFTYLNPHTWLDTVVLLGSIGAQQDVADRLPFGAGASTASAAWFVSLGYGARWLEPLFAKPMTWRVLDTGIALTMGGLAWGLLRTA